MYIKEIKMNGFKSFVDRVNITLDKTFTGIVGPNGSGKSNIVDAVKWVLGEQSVKNLRGSSAMSDVIFAGSKTRKPSSSASVTLVFDNSDFHLPTEYTEVSIKRVVYRSGENEYFLNNTRCRLKDITDLFVDSFSSKESFNIISQGKVSEVLSNNSLERRSIIEEAAGVLKYKTRKKESLRKLDRTNENISRINMIISELNESIIPLKTQSEKAIAYKKAKEKLTNLEVALTVLDITEADVLYKKKNEKINEINEMLAKDDKKSTNDEVKLEKLKLQSIKLDEKINELQKEIIELSTKLTKLSEQKELLRERSKYDSTDIKVKNNLLDIKEKKLKLTSDKKVLENEINALESELEKINKVIEEYTSDYKELENKHKLYNDEFSILNKKYMELKYKKSILEESIKNSSKIPYSVRNVLENPKINGIINTIGKLIDVEEKYSTAVETALSSALNFVVVENEEVAKEAIDYLKKNKIGRVTFFPMNVIKPKAIDNNTLGSISNDSGFISLAYELVSYDKKFHNIITNQLGNIIVAKDIDSAIRISKKINHRYRVVSLDGELIHVGGSLTGGSRNNTNSVIGEKFEFNRITNLLKFNKEEIESKEKKIKEINYNIEVLRENIYKRTSIKVKSSEELTLKKKTLKEMEENLTRINNEYENLSKNSGEKLDKEFNKISEEFYKFETEKQNKENELNISLNKKKEYKEDIELIEESIKKQNINYNKLTNELKNNEIEKIKLENIIDNALTLLNENYNLTYELAKDKYELDLPVDEARTEVNKLKAEIRSYGEVNLGSIEEYERLNKRYNFLTNEKEDLVKSEENLLGIINEMDEEMELRFIETFNKVNAEFKKVFNTLFGGGEAYLELTEPDNILETGVDIKAVPPGKKLSNISLLSGGEKTLTAISLLFAIMNLKDVPFAILDEVEAALDEANVERFGSYLEHYRNKTQLLIITHKKKTMEYVDLLYGVTMQESGVSKLVSVRLEDAK